MGLYNFFLLGEITGDEFLFCFFVLFFFHVGREDLNSTFLIRVIKQCN